MADVAWVPVPNGVTKGKTHIINGASLAASFPTMASVNADYTDWNQLIAFYNRRANQIMGTPVILSYFSGPQLIASDITAMQSDVNNLRNMWGLGNYPFNATTPTQGKKILAVHYDDMLAALQAFNAPFTRFTSGLQFMNRTDSPSYGNQTALTNTGTATAIGKSIAPTTTSMHRTRLGMPFVIPSGGYASTLAVTLHIAFNSFTNTLGESSCPAVYAGSTATNALTTWYSSNLTTKLGVSTYGTSGDINLTLSTSGVNTYAGSTMGVVIGQALSSSGNDGELFGAGIGLPSTSGTSARFSVDLASVATPYLTLDAGF